MVQAEVKKLVKGKNISASMYMYLNLFALYLVVIQSKCIFCTNQLQPQPVSFSILGTAGSGSMIQKYCSFSVNISMSHDILSTLYQNTFN